jgi:hypothetical protein
MKPRVALMGDAATLPSEVASAFAAEGIGALAGTFGYKSRGEPVEIDDLDVETDTGRISIRVYERGVGLMADMGGELLRLHRFFSVIDVAPEGGPAPRFFA